MDSNLEVEVGRVFEQGWRVGWGESRSGHVIRETLISFGRNHDRSSRQLPRGTASYTNSRPQHRVWEGFNVTAARTGEFIVICNRGRSSFLAVRLSAALRGVHPLCCPSDRNSLLPCRTAIARSSCMRIRASPWTARKIHRYRRTHRTDSRLTRLSAQTRNQFRSNPDQRYFARRALTPPPRDWRILACTSRADQDSFTIDASRVSLIFGILGRTPPPDSRRSLTSASITNVWQHFAIFWSIQLVCSKQRDVGIFVPFDSCGTRSPTFPIYSLPMFRNFYQSAISAKLFLGCSSDRVRQTRILQILFSSNATTFMSNDIYVC